MIRAHRGWLPLLLFACGFAGSVAGEPASAGQSLSIGILSYRGSDIALSTWGATAVHLRAALPGVEVQLRPLGLEALTAAAVAGEVDFVITNPGHSFQLQWRAQASRLATARSMATEDQTRAVGSVIVSRAGGPIDSLEQLRGRTLGVVALDAFGGDLVARAQLLEVFGDDPGVRPKVVGFPHEAVLSAVLDGSVDAGVVRACLIESLADSGALEPRRLKVLGQQQAPRFHCRTSTELYPGWAFMKMPHVSSGVATEVTRALFAMERPAQTDPWLGHDGWIAPVSYQAVEAVYRTLGLYPFTTDLAAVAHRWIRDNLAWIAVAIALLAAFLLHVVHVEILVRRRTRDLETAAQRARSLEGELAHADRVSSLNVLAASLAHDLRQPLAAISTYAHGLLVRHRRGTADAKSLETALRQISEQANRASAFIASMRDFLTKQPERHETLDIRELVEESLMLLTTHARSHDCQLDWQRPSEALLVRVDSIQLRQVLVALVQNAIEAGGTAGQVEIGAARASGRVAVTVADRGAGLSAEAQARAFDPFYSTKGGLGLGLATATSIVARHEGNIELAPRPEGGTMARLTLPEMCQAAGEDR